MGHVRSHMTEGHMIVVQKKRNYSKSFKVKHTCHNTLVCLQDLLSKGFPLITLLVFLLLYLLSHSRTHVFLSQPNEGLLKLSSPEPATKVPARRPYAHLNNNNNQNARVPTITVLLMKHSCVCNNLLQSVDKYMSALSGSNGLKD